MPGNEQRRARYRAEVRAAIKTTALAHIARDGVASLTLTGVAKELGVSGPALYKYFKGRDDLLTELIVDGFADAAATLRAAVAAAPANPRAQLHALATAYRNWALAQPHRYLLLTAAPMPHYEAPPETVASARAVITPLLAVLAAAKPDQTRLSAQLASWIAADESVSSWVRTATPSLAFTAAPTGAAHVLAAALRAWTRIHGVVGAEAAGTFAGMGLDPGTLLAAEVDALATELSLPDEYV